MTHKAIGRLRQGASTRTGIIFVPAELMNDSAFPIRVPSAVKITIEGNKLVVQGVKA